MNPWGITPREQEVLDRLADLGCNKTVAKEMNLSIRTVEAHMGSALSRMGLRHRLQAVVWWDRWKRSENE
jgi:DNA-binding NarL/FixJ family response regulator